MAINIALAVNGSPTVFALIVALAASNNFVTGSNAVTTLISGPAGYRRQDFWQAGLPLMVGFILISVVMVNVMF
jgi:di/tricarboxylate transporter